MIYSSINFNISAGSVGSLNSLSAANRALNQSYTRIRTGNRINSASDDPSGLVDSVNLTRNINSAEVAIKNNQESYLQMSKVDSAQQTIVEALQQIRTEVQSVVNEADPTVRQTALDSVISLLEAIDSTASSAKIGGKNVLDGNGKISLGASASSLLNISDTGIRKTAKDTSMFMRFDTADTAEQAYIRDAYNSPTAGNDAVVRLTTDEGTKTIQITAGTNINDATAQLNNALKDIGGEATVDGGNIIVNTKEYGDSKSIKVETVSGDDIFSAATVQDLAGKTGSVNINGKVYQLSGNLDINYTDGITSGYFKFDETKVGINKSTGAAAASANINLDLTGGTFIQFGAETDPLYNSAVVGYQSLKYANLNLDEIIDAADPNYMLTNPEKALDVIDEAIAKVSSSLTSNGTFMRDNLESTTDYLRSLVDDIYEQRSLIMDTNQAEEMLKAAKADMMQQAGISALTSQVNSHRNILSVLDVMS